VSKHKIGDKVMSLVAAGGYAQYLHRPGCPGDAIAVPPSLSMNEAGAIPETLMTVWHKCVRARRVETGRNAADPRRLPPASDTMAIQLAKAFGSKVIVTVGSREKADACIKLGAIAAINYKTVDFVAEVKTATDGRGRQCHSRHGRRRNTPSAIRRRGDRRPRGPDRPARRPQGKCQSCQADGETPAPHRFDVASRTNADKAAMVAAIEAKVMPLLREGA